MELRHIRYFLAIAETQSFTRAAENLGIAQPPLSQQIKVMEKEIGTRLFRRLPHGVELTSAGRAFRSVVEQIPDQVQEGVRQAQRAATGETGILRIGFTGTAALSPIVPTCIRTFGAVYPEVDLHVTEENTIALVSALIANDLDVAFLRTVEGRNEGIALEILAREPLIAVLPASHPVAIAGQPVELSELKADHFILTPRQIGVSIHDAVLEACSQAGFSPKLGPPAPHIVSILSLVAANLGVSLVPHSVGTVGMHNIVFLPLRGDTKAISLAAAYNKGSISPTVRNFMGVARATLKR